MTTIGSVTIVIDGEVSCDEDLTIEGQVRRVRVGAGRDGHHRRRRHASRPTCERRGSLIRGDVRGAIAASERIELGAASAVEGSLSAGRDRDRRGRAVQRDHRHGPPDHRGQGRGVPGRSRERRVARRRPDGASPSHRPGLLRLVRVCRLRRRRLSRDRPWLGLRSRALHRRHCQPTHVANRTRERPR